MTRARATLEPLIFCALILGAVTFVVAVRSRTNWDQDIWWHLRTGQWILEHGRLPATDPFSQYGQGKAFVAYSWLFDWIVAITYGALGLKGLVLLPAALGALIAAAFYLVVRRLGAPLWTALVVTALGFYAMMPLTTPRPWLCSILLLLIEMHVIVSTQHQASSTQHRWLWLLPPLFVLWVNLHIQFIVGLIVLAAAVVDAVWRQRIDPARHAGNQEGPSLSTWIVVAALCGVATLVNPHHVRIWFVARDLMGMALQWTYIGDFQAPDFRHDPDWVRLALTLAAAACLGWQLRHRRIGVFLLLVFLLGVYLGFKARRDTWINVIGAACVIASTGIAVRREPLESNETADFPTWLGASLAVPIAVLACVGNAMLFSETTLRTNIARSYPDRAAAFIEQHDAASPIYNYFDWGGYLMWRLPRFPVSMDGRVLVHGEPRILQHIDTWQGKPGWRSDPDLAAAAIVVGPRDTPLASLLRLDERFTLVYEDRDGPAVVFEARARK